MSTLSVHPSGPLTGTVTVPGDKSITHRAIILSALAEGRSVLHGYCRGEDCLHTAQAFRAMGVRIDAFPDTMAVHGKGMWGLTEPDGPLDCGNSGTGIRLLAGLLSGQDFFTILTGDASIRRRPMGRVVKPLRLMGATIAGRKGGELAPLAITGCRLHGIEYESPVASAQVKSALLLAALYADGPTSIGEPTRSRDHTERMFQAFAIPVHTTGRGVRLPGRPSVGWAGREMIIPGDLSAAAFFLVAASLVPDSDLTIRSVGVNPSRTGVLEVLGQMGARIERLNQRETDGEPIADLRVRSAPLRGAAIGADLIPQTIDELPALCVAAALAEGTTRVTGAGELRVKESDRIATLAAELRKLGVAVTEAPDGMTIEGTGGRLLRGARCASHGDHRVAMSMAIAGLRANGGTTVDDTACVGTSFPGFATTLSGLCGESCRRRE